MSNILNIALSGLQAAQAGMSVTSNNISNQGVAGYSRQNVIQESATSNFTGSGYFGQGVNIVDVQRAYNSFLTSQATQAASSLSFYSTYSNQMGSLMDRMGDSDSGINGSFNDLFSAMSAFGDDASTSAPRQGAYDAAQSTAARFRSLSQELSDLRNGSNQQINAATGQVNSLVQSIASYNDQIQTAIGNGGGSEPNELLDQRDAMVRQLGQLVGITTSTQGNSINVFLSSGQPLVVGDNASQLKFDASADDNNGTSGFSLITGGRSMPLRESDIDGGQIGALLQFRDNELSDAQAQLGKLAIGMAAMFNQQQQFGLDSDGNPGTPLFKVGSPVVEPDLHNAGDAVVSANITDTRSLTGSDYDVTFSGGNYVVTRSGSNDVVGTFTSLPQEVEGITIAVQSGGMADGDSVHIDLTHQAAAGMDVVLPDSSGLAGAAPMELDTPSTNTGTGTVSRLRSAESGAVDYGQSVNVVFTSSTAYELRDSSGQVLDSGTLSPPNTTISHNGWAFDLTGTPAAGDSFTVGASSGDPSGDNRNAVAMGALNTVDLPSGGTLTDTYASLVSDLGTRAASINASTDAQQASFNQASDAEQSSSGVSMDEEGANLIRYQQAYAAAGKVLSMASQMFDDLIAAMG